LGPHEPWHEALLPFWTQVWLPQSAGEPSWPFDPHDCRELPEHCAVPTVHEPVHAPPLHVPTVQGTPVPQLPVLSQVCTPPLPHWVAFGEQTPWQAAFPELSTTHAWLLQAVPVFQAPVASQVCAAPLEHRIVLGAHTPWHPPLTQARLPQSVGALQVPADKHV
jgi:hypothetical protein